MFAPPHILVPKRASKVWAGALKKPDCATDVEQAKCLKELMAETGAQVASDWVTSIY